MTSKCSAGSQSIAVHPADLGDVVPTGGIKSVLLFVFFSRYLAISAHSNFALLSEAKLIWLSVTYPFSTIK